MPLPALAQPGDLAALLSGIALDPARAMAAIATASALVRSYTQQDWLDLPVPDAIQVAVLNVARRVYVQPDDNVTQETMGPFSVTRSGGLWLSNTDRMLLAPYRAGSITASINPVSMTERWTWPNHFVDIQGEPFSDPVEVTGEEVGF
jgi:hypothetical protein